MGRPRKFEPEDAVDAAMRAFWDSGFHGVSFDQLVAQTGASRHGLYKEFGDKDRLLLASIKHYEQAVLGDLVSELLKEDSGVPEIKRFFHRIAEIARYESDGAGCLICNSQLELPANELVANYIERFFARLRGVFEQCLEKAKALGQLEQDTDVQALSFYLVGLVHSISANAQSNPSDEAYDTYMKIALSVLG